MKFKELSIGDIFFLKESYNDSDFVEALQKVSKEKAIDLYGDKTKRLEIDPNTEVCMIRGVR